MTTHAADAPKMTTDLPAAITTPDVVETRVGTLIGARSSQSQVTFEPKSPPPDPSGRHHKSVIALTHAGIFPEEESS